MKNKIFLPLMAFCLLSGWTIVNPARGEEPPQRIHRLMTYNIHNGIGLDGKTDYARVARVIAQCNPDVIAVQEADSATLRSQRRVVLSELAAHTGMHAIFAAAIDYEGGKYGIGILSKDKPISSYRIALPGREEARVLLVAEFPEYLFACTHLSLTEADRCLSVELLRQEAKRFNKPFFLAGDWNTHPDEPFMKQLAADFILLTGVEQATYPADQPSETIDYIAVSAKTGTTYKIINREVVEERVASDHRPIWCDICFK